MENELTLEYKKKSAWASIWCYIAVMYVVVYIIAAVAGLVLKGLGIDVKDPVVLENANTVINFIIYVVIMIPIIIINRKILIEDGKKFIKNKQYAARIAGGFVIFYVISYIVSLMVQNIEHYMQFANNVLGIHKIISSTSDNQTTIANSLHSNYAFFMFASAAFFGPFVEEMIFRKSIFQVSKSPELGIILSSFIFGMIHIVSSLGNYSLMEILLMTLPYVASGFGFALVYKKNDYNIWYTVIIHMLSNIISMIGLLLVS